MPEAAARFGVTPSGFVLLPRVRGGAGLQRRRPTCPDDHETGKERTMAFRTSLAAAHNAAFRNVRRVCAALAAVSVLAACGGGGGGNSGEGPAGPGPALDAIRAVTRAAPPAETVADQIARVPGIVSRADSLIVSTIHGETSSPFVPAFDFRASCTGTVCTLMEPRTGYEDTVRLSEFGFVSGRDEPVGTKHGVTLVRSTVRNDGIEVRSLGAWMQDSAFGVRMERSTFEGVRIDARYGLAGGELTGSRPSGGATWRGQMVGTPTAGADSGDRLQGDAILTYDLDSERLDAEFTDIRNIDRLGRPARAARFDGIDVGSNGTFEAGIPGNRIQGGFYGSGHAEAGGIFEQSNIVGAFGAKKQ